MEWIDWRPFYLDIVDRLNLNPLEDFKATVILDSLLENMNSRLLLDNLRKLIENQIVVVCGAGPSLDRHLLEISSSELKNDAIFIAADGAASALKEYEYNCQAIVTDLDGNMRDILELAKRGAIPIIHAHGDNIEKIKRFVPEFDSLIGSTQVEPTEHVFLWGGFTDGDRACYIASHYNPERIILIGMDFGAIVGRWSKPGFSEHHPASKRKRIKLKIAEELISILMGKEGIVIEKIK